MSSQPIRRETQSRHEILCPSAPPTEGALLLSIMGPGGNAAYLRDRLPVTAEFLAEADKTHSIDQRFRFASPCQHGACAQWSNNECTIPGRLAQIMPPASDADIPRCSIRASCRWHSQSGFAACSLCPLVIRTEKDSENKARGLKQQ
jgi:hypothetical protein